MVALGGRSGEPRLPLVEESLAAAGEMRVVRLPLAPVIGSVVVLHSYMMSFLKLKT